MQVIKDILSVCPESFKEVSIEHLKQIVLLGKLNEMNLDQMVTLIYLICRLEVNNKSVHDKYWKII